MMKHLVLALLLLLTLAAPFAGAVDPVNINTATADELALLSNVGPSKAAAIVAYREQHGPFGSVQELTRVSGIGERIVEMNLERIRID